MSDASVVRVERDGGVGSLVLNRPDKFNCISSAVIAGLDGGLTALESEPSVRAVLVRAEGRHFCTGADLEEILALRRDPPRLEAFTLALHRVLRRFETSPLPVVAVVQGLALAGGLETVMACDVVFAAHSARLGDQHAQYGLIPGGGNSQRLPRIVGRRRALDLMFSARWLEAEVAHQWGLVNYVVADDELQGAALEYARMLAARSARGLATMKRLVDEGLGMGYWESLEHEARVAAKELLAPDVEEGLAAFREKRTPRFGERGGAG